jgi:hypothetical protein
MSLAQLMRAGALRALATATPATFATQEPETARPVATVATVAVAEPPPAIAEPHIAPINDPEFSDPDRWCWPDGDAMNGEELDLMSRRIKAFQRRGMPEAKAEHLADSLVRRDRDSDDRRLCIECSNLQGQQCGAWRTAGAGRNVAAVVMLPQRCAGFKAAT